MSNARYELIVALADRVRPLLMRKLDLERVAELCNSPEARFLVSHGSAQYEIGIDSLGKTLIRTISRRVTDEISRIEKQLAELVPETDRQTGGIQLTAAGFLLQLDELLQSINDGKNTPEETRSRIQEFDKLSDRFASQMKIPRSRKNGKARPASEMLESESLRQRLNDTQQKLQAQEIVAKVRGRAARQDAR